MFYLHENNFYNLYLMKIIFMMKISILFLFKRDILSQFYLLEYKFSKIINFIYKKKRSQLKI